MDRYLALCGMEEAERSLIGLYCAEQFSEKGLADWFSRNDFEGLRPELSCMASALSTAHDCLGAPPALIPRLRGIMKYVHTLNSGMTAGLCVLGKKYNECGISAMLVGSTAIQLAYPNRPRRHMWRTELCVPEEHFLRAVDLAQQAGFAIEQTAYSATARCGNTQCVLIHKGMEGTQNTMNVNGVSFMMPGNAELLVSLAQTAFRALLGADGKTKLFAFAMDFHCAIAAKPNWDEVAVAARERGLSTQMRLMLELYHALSSSTEIKNILHLFSSEKRTKRMAELILKYRGCKPNSLKCRWLGAQIRNDALPLEALWKIVTRKLTPVG